MTQSKGRGTGTLNHLVGPGPVKEWVDLMLEEERLLARLQLVAAERSMHEVVLRMAGVPRDDLEMALKAAKNPDPSQTPSQPAEPLLRAMP
jgi:hypothetical protein